MMARRWWRRLSLHGKVFGLTHNRYVITDYSQPEKLHSLYEAITATAGNCSRPDHNDDGSQRRRDLAARIADMSCDISNIAPGVGWPRLSRWRSAGYEEG